MTRRSMVALWAALWCLGPAFAQVPVGVPSGPPLEAPGLPFAGYTPYLGVGGPPPAPPPAPAPAGPLAPAGYPIPGNRVWVTGEYVIGFIIGNRVPPLVTTSPLGVTPTAAGVIGIPGTTTLFGGRVNEEGRSGFRLQGGYWFDQGLTWGAEGGLMFLENRSQSFRATSDQFPILARPFFNALTGGGGESVIVAFPGRSTGSVDVTASSGNFQELHLDLTGNLVAAREVRVDALGGYRFVRFDDGVRISQSISPLTGPFVPGTTIASEDHFSTRNIFNGLDLGLRAQFLWCDNVSLTLLGKVAIGCFHREVKIDGGTLTTVPGAAPASQVGGVLALASNIGKHTRDDFSALPEFGATLGYQVTPNVRVQLGYTLILLDGVVRAGDQIDLNINPNFFPPAREPLTPTRPRFDFVRSDVVLQALTLGVTFAY